MNESPYGLARFVIAQDPVYAAVKSELSAGLKRSHWMWFIFPQLHGLGDSKLTQHYGIAGRAEAIAYLAHPLLRARLRECTQLALKAEGRSAHQIFGTPDELKFRSSMTLFAAVAPEDPLFVQVLAHYFGGVPDPLTLRLLDIL